MGLPEINIVFQSKAETAIKRSANGIVALILRDATKGDITSYSYTNESEVVKSHWTTANYDYISKTFLGGPQRVIVERIGAEDTYDDALARLKIKSGITLQYRRLPITKKILRIGLSHREVRKRHLKPYFRMRRIMRVL